MNDKRSNSLNKHHSSKKVLEKENKNLYEELYNNMIKSKSNLKQEKKNKGLLHNNQNNFNSINIINNNYNNIIINNKLTPNKKLIIEDKTSSVNKKNYKNMNIGENNQKMLIKSNHDKDNDLEFKYKLILNEKNNLINKLRSEVNHYKNQNKNQLHSPQHGATNRNNIEFDDIRNKMRNIFSLQKKDNHNGYINDYNSIKTYVGKPISKSKHNIKYNNFETSNNFMPQINSHNSINLNSIDNNGIYQYNNKLLFNYSLKNDMKLNKNKLTLDINNNNNYNSLETDRNYKFTLRSPKLIYNNNNNNFELNNYSNNYNYNYNHITFEDNMETKPSFKNIKNSKYCFNSIATSPFSLKKGVIKDKIGDDNSNEIVSSSFNYKEKYDNLKKRMYNLIENLFELIEQQNNNINIKDN